MTRNLCIGTEEEVQELGDFWVTPDEAVGEIIICEIPGTMGKKFYEIVEVDLENKETIIEDIHTGEQCSIGDDALTPNYNRFSRPHLGREDRVWIIQHRNGRGEWVDVTDPSRAYTLIQKRRMNYVGHEQTRIVSRSHKYFPENVGEFDIFWNQSDGAHAYIDDTYDFEVVRQQVRDDIDNRTVVGQVYVDSQKEEIVSYNIYNGYQSETHKSHVETLENWMI